MTIKIIDAGLVYQGAPLQVDQTKDFDAITEAQYVATGKAVYLDESFSPVVTPPVSRQTKVVVSEVNPLTGGIEYSSGVRTDSAARRFRNRATNLRLIEGFAASGETITTQPSAGGTVTLVDKATNKKIHGNRGARIVTAAGTPNLLGGVTVTGKSFGAFTDTTVFCLAVDAAVLNAANVDYFVVRLSSDGGAAKYLQWTVYTNTAKAGVQHYYFTRSKDCTVNAGELTTNDFNYCRVQFKNTTGTLASEATVLGLWAFEPPKSTCMIYFDDAFASVYTEAFPYMKALGIRGFIPVIADYVGTTGYCTLAQLHEMRNAGWDMGTHGITNHNTLGNYAAIVADINYNRQFLRDNGLVGSENIYTYIGGGVLPEPSGSISALRDNGFIAARSTLGTPDAYFVGTAPWVDNMFFFSGPGPGEVSWGDGSAVLARLDQAAVLGASWHVYFHDIQTVITDSSIQLTPTHFRQYIDKIKSLIDAGSMVNLTPMEWYDSVRIA